MVRVIAYKERRTKDGKSFISLVLQGELVMVQSAETGRFYATAKECTITSTFTDEEAAALIGKEIPGRIAKVPCEEYDYTLQDTGKVITLTHRWEYLPEDEPTPLRVVHSNMAA